MDSLNVKDLLLAPRLDPQQVTDLLKPYGFENPVNVDANLQAMTVDPTERQLLADVVEDVLQAAARSANPDQSLNYLHRFAEAALNKTRLFAHLKEFPAITELLLKTLGGSPYMAEILIRDPHHFYWLTDPEILDSIHKKRAIERELIQTLKVLENEQRQLDYLRFFKRREMLHIGVRDLLRLCSVEQTLTALSIVAEALISAAYWICASALRREYGIRPKVFTDFTILAMGKLGGGELNFSSDVDLTFIYGSERETAGSVEAFDYFRRLCQKITSALNDLTAEGYVYRVDLRLRPEGHGSKIVNSFEDYKRYFRSRLRTWERLSLLKAWPVAGSRELGRMFLNTAAEYIYALPFESKALEDVRQMKRQIDQEMLRRDQQERNVKLGTGGIREIELITQSLQVRFGAGFPDIRQRNTMAALGALFTHSIISPEERDTLCKAYLFLRDVENKLQMVNDAQTHSLPRAYEELNACARLLGYPGAEPFLREYQYHTGHVSRIFASIDSVLSRQ
jgi:[glutamine synthetase] adenylyltransferase / [glutamine synthetase]-adenylyl-L-tyrosine phosphorylase